MLQFTIKHMCQMLHLYEYTLFYSNLCLFTLDEMAALRIIGLLLLAALTCEWRSAFIGPYEEEIYEEI